MLASRTVCARCRSRLLAGAAAIRTARPNSTASFPSPPAGTTPEAAPQPPQARAPNASPRKLKAASQESARKRSLDLFESAVNSSKAQSSPEETIQQADELYRLADQLAQFLQNKERLSDVEVAVKSYAFLTTKVVPAFRQPEAPMPRILMARSTAALRRIAVTKLANIHDTELPRVSDICKLYADINQHKVRQRLFLVEGLLNAIVAPKPVDPNISGLATHVIDESCLDDLVEFWKHFSGLPRGCSGLDSETQFWLTSRPDMKAAEEPIRLLRALFPLHPSNSMDSLGPALVTTYVLLSEPAYEHTKAREEAEPLLEALEPIIKRFDREMLRRLFENSPVLWQFVEPRADWRVIHMAPEALKESSIPLLDESNPSQSPGRFSYALWHHRFNTTFRANDHPAAQQAWRDFIDTSNDKDRQERLLNCPELFDYVLHLCCSKSNLEPTIYTKMTAEVLAFMKNLGLELRLRTYTSMMEGWRQARRIEPIEQLWHSINRAGMELDPKIWSCRISALGQLGPPWAGIKALTDMDKAWEEAVKLGTEDRAVEPGITHVNAAISGLLRKDRMDAVQKVLLWANAKKIKPDIYTYNMLLSRMLKRGSTEEVDQILASMKAAGLTPDGATFTIIVEAAFAHLGGRPAQEQRAAIDNVFREMAACGVEPNQETYAKMLHSLIRAVGDVAHSSVAAVLAHLRGSGLQPSTEICTILVDYYVSRERPDLDAIRALVADRRSRTRAMTDRVFWETVIKHYHYAGELDGALEIVYDLDDWGIWPALPLLEPLLRSLVHRRDWDAARKLVDTVRRQARPQAEDRDGRYWKHAFWAVARDYGLM